MSIQFFNLLFKTPEAVAKSEDLLQQIHHGQRAKESSAGLHL